MKIIIASTVVPFIYGGGVFIVDWLKTKLREYGHTVEVFKIPFYSYYPKMMNQMLALRLFDLTNSCDRLITIRTPSYLLRHPNKVLWFIHHHRGAYDLWNTKYQDLPDNDTGQSIRSVLIKADNLAFKEAKKIYTNSKLVSKRLKKYNGFDSEVLYPPLMNSEKYYCEDYQDYIFYPSRITQHKRQYLAIEAMQYVKSNAKLVIAGKPDVEDYIQVLQELIKKYGVEKKVKLISRWISQEEKQKIFAHSLASLYIPYLEDSYGYVSLESFYSRKAVITCTDSGGTLELIKNMTNGFIVKPEAKSIAKIIDRLFFEKKLAKSLGEEGLNTINNMDISWQNVVTKLTKQLI